MWLRELQERQTLLVYETLSQTLLVYESLRHVAARAAGAPDSSAASAPRAPIRSLYAWTRAYSSRGPEQLQLSSERDSTPRAEGGSTSLYRHSSSSFPGVPIRSLYAYTHPLRQDKSFLERAVTASSKEVTQA